MIIVVQETIAYVVIHFVSHEIILFIFLADFPILELVNLHILVTDASPRWTLIAAATSTPLKLVHFENLFGFRGTLGRWVINFLNSALVV